MTRSFLSPSPADSFSLLPRSPSTLCHTYAYDTTCIHTTELTLTLLPSPTVRRRRESGNSNQTSRVKSQDRLVYIQHKQYIWRIGTIQTATRPSFFGVVVLHESLLHIFEKARNFIDKKNNIHIGKERGCQMFNLDSDLRVEYVSNTIIITVPKKKTK